MRRYDWRVEFADLDFRHPEIAGLIAGGWVEALARLEGALAGDEPAREEEPSPDASASTLTSPPFLATMRLSTPKAECDASRASASASAGKEPPAHAPLLATMALDHSLKHQSRVRARSTGTLSALVDDDQGAAPHNTRGTSATSPSASLTRVHSLPTFDHDVKARGQALRRSSSLKDILEHWHAPEYGFKSWEEYLSAIPVSDGSATDVPLLIMHSWRDNIFNVAHLPVPLRIAKENSNILVVIADGGSHVSRYDGRGVSGCWGARTVTEFFQATESLARTPAQRPGHAVKLTG